MPLDLSDNDIATLTAKIQAAIIKDLMGRRGFRQVMNEIDDDIQNEITAKQLRLISEAFHDFSTQ